MKREGLLLAALAIVVLSACGPAQLDVTVQREVADPDTDATVVRPISDVEVRLLPFDRDEVFDSLSNAYSTPEPEIPDSVLEAQQAVQDAQEKWRNAQSRWQATRDRLQEINKEMKGLSRGEARYVALFREFQQLDGQLGRLDREVKQTFNEFDSLQKSTLDAAQEIRLRREDWEEEAFADAGQVFEARLKKIGREIQVDTTDAQGMVEFRVPPGRWWVHARYELPYEELYWNQPLTVERGDPMAFTLDENNAKKRPKL